MKLNGLIQNSNEKKLADVRNELNYKYREYKSTVKTSLKYRLEKMANYHNYMTKYDGKSSLQKSNVSEDYPTKTKTVTKRPKIQYTCIIGDSILKDVKAPKIESKLTNSHKVLMECHKGTTTARIKQHVKISLEKKPDRMIIHVGTNDLNTEATEQQIAQSIVDLASFANTNSTSVAISSITHREDKWLKKANKVYSLMEQMCSERNICYIVNNNINKIHLNGSNLHLNKNGTKLLTKNLAEVINKY